MYKKWLLFLFVLWFTSTAFAIDFHHEAKLTFTTADGRSIAGTGQVNEDEIRIELAQGFTGFAVLLIENEDYSIETVDVTILEDGWILIVQDTDFVELADLARGANFALNIEWVSADELDDSRGRGSDDGDDDRSGDDNNDEDDDDGHQNRNRNRGGDDDDSDDGDDDEDDMDNDDRDDD